MITTPPPAVWVYTDGKAGHENQSRGLVQALAKLTPLDVHWVPAPPRLRSLRAWLTRRLPDAATRPDPQLLIGAGHATHLALLAARRARGGRAVVLMKPSLPRACFDLCLIPEHDGVPPGPHVLVTRGALNAMQPCGDRRADAGLILIGGPSAHYGWDDARLLAQVGMSLDRDPALHWTLTTSRRTPPHTLDRLRALASGRLTVVPFADTDRAWLPAQLARAARVWVTEDSVSMIYEALTAGAATGILEIPRRRDSRISRGIDALLRDGLVTSHAGYVAGAGLAPPATPFNEAARAAAWIHGQWLKSA